MGSSLWQKVGASAVNCSLVMLLSTPFYLLLPYSGWKLVTVSLFFAYNVTFRRRCIGMWMVRTYQPRPTSILYAALYTAGFATFFYSILVPFDLLMLNTSMQCVSLKLTGNTLHANIARSGTMTKDQYLERVKGRAKLLVLEGKYQPAVAIMKQDLSKYPEMDPAPWIVELGLVFANAGQEEHLVKWIDGFQ